MATQTPVHSERHHTMKQPAGIGWLVFAGTMLMIVGTMNVIYGIAAVSDSSFYVNDAKYVISDLNTWGWLMIGIGAAQFLVAYGIFVGTQWGRWLGVLAAGCNSIVMLLAIPSYPFLALALFAMDVLIIYGLVVYGGYRSRA